jgi:hypothetical protein
MMQGPPRSPGIDATYLLNQIAPLIALVVVGALGVVVLRVLLRSPFGEAVAEQIRERTRRRFGPAPGSEAPRLAELEDQVARPSGQVSELAERLDFAERMLAARRERTLGAGQ